MAIKGPCAETKPPVVRKTEPTVPRTETKPVVVKSEPVEKIAVVKDIIEPSSARHAADEGVGARLPRKAPPSIVQPPEKPESPDIQIIGHLQPPKTKVGVCASPKVSPSLSRPHLGSITQGTPIRQMTQAAVIQSLPNPASIPTSVAGVRHVLHPYEGLLRPATPFPLSREDPTVAEVSRVSPLVFSAGGIAEAHPASSTTHLLQAAGAQVHQAQALAQAQQQYRHALSLGLSEPQAAQLYQQTWSHL